MSSELSPDTLVDEVLKNFGFTDMEAAVYRTSLALGSRPASVLAEKSGIKRSHTYNVLDSLIKKGVVQEFVKNSVRQFTSSPPQSLLSIAERREQELKRHKEDLRKIIPMLEKESSSLSKPRVRFYQGLEGIKEIYEDTLRTPEENIYGLCDFKYSVTFSHGDAKEWINGFIQRRAKAGIWWYGIINQSPESDEALTTRHWANREVRMLTGFDLPVMVNIYGNKVSITSTHGETIGVVIESEPIARTLKGIHKGVWELLPEYSAAASRVNKS